MEEKQVITVPKSTKILLFVGLLASFQVFLGFIPGWIVFIALAYILIRAIRSYHRWCNRLDYPEVREVPLPAPATYHCIKKAIQTHSTYSKNIKLYIDWDEPEPPPDHPIEIHATFNIRHNWLADYKQFLSDDDQDLTSRVILKFEITDKGDKSDLKIVCQTQELVTRHIENNAVQTLYNDINRLIDSYSKKFEK